MAWINNKHETLSSTSDTMDTTSMTASDFGVFLNHGIPSGGDTQTSYSVNGVDTGSKYALRTQKNGATDTTSASQNKVVYDAGGESDDKFSITYACDIAGEEKLFIGFGISRKEAGAGNAPTRSEVVWKYATTSARVTAVKDDTSSQSGTYAIGSNLSAIGDSGVRQIDREALTNVPAGTRYEETDTRKIYSFNSNAPWTSTNWTERGDTPSGAFRGVFGGGSLSSSQVNTMDYVTIGTLGNAIDFGDLTVTRSLLAGVFDATRGVFCGGRGGGTYYNTLDYVTIGTAGNATDFGDNNTDNAYMAGCSSDVRGCYGGGWR